MYEIKIFINERMCLFMGFRSQSTKPLKTKLIIPCERKSRVTNAHLTLKLANQKPITVYKYNEHNDVLEAMAKEALSVIG